MSDISASLTRQVVERARNRCEYCGLSQIGQEATFHIDHIVPRAVNGPTQLENLALSCVSCSLRKGARQSAVDPANANYSALFNPRSDRWDEHFQWNEFILEGLTSIGRATVAALNMNRPLILAIREEEAERGRHPPPNSI